MIRRALYSGLVPFALAALLSGPLQAQTTDEEENAIPEGINESDCAKVPGGNAPVNVLARIQGGMAVENLEFTYFDKKLFQLTQADFDYLKRLIPYCRDQSSEQTDYIIDRLAALVLEAQETRQKTIDWIRETTATLDTLPPSRDSIEQVHNVWTDLQNRLLEMTKADAKYLAEKINETRDRLYRETELTPPAAQRSDDPMLRVSPFLPAVPNTERRPDPS